MAPAVSMNLFDQIEALCSDYRRQLKRGGQKQIEAYLSEVDEVSRQMLFRNLLHLDIEFRRRRHEEPASEDYIARFPQFANVIRQAFFDSTVMSMDPSVETPGNEKTVLYGMPAARQLGQYELLKELGRGGFGVVFQARHLQRKHVVALKTLPTSQDGQSHPLQDAERLHRFRREFRSLVNMNHPNLVGMQTLEVDGNQWFFTMDLVEGLTFLEYVRPDDQLNERRLRQTLPQLIRGVQALHARHVIHRDLKPSNVMVRFDGQVRLLDFGLVVDLRTEGGSERGGEIAGTPNYMAPEQFEGTATPASDWYAVGVMLYEALTGRLPFKGTIQQILQARLTSEPPPITTDVPLAFRNLCYRLLSREPRDRPRAEEIHAIVCPDEAPLASTLTTDIATTRLLGRDSQIRQIEGALQAFATHDGPRTIFIRGRSGEGKTVLAEHFLEQFRQDAETVVLSGRCYDRESVPFKAVDTLIDALCGRLLAMPREEVATLLTPDVAILSELFPVLTRVPAVNELERFNLDEVELDRIHRVAGDALRVLLERLSRKQRLVCFIDDLQWGDRDSAELLLHALRPPGAPHVLWIGTYRSDEAVDSHFLQAWSEGTQRTSSAIPHTDCEVNPLNREECVALVMDVVGQDTPSVRDWAVSLLEETGGNALLLAELASCYDLQATGSGLLHIEDVIERKLSMLPDEARDLLSIVAVAGSALSLEEAARTGGHDSVPFATITHMRSERLVRLVGAEEQLAVDTYHDKIREMVLHGMQDSRRKALHVTLAEVIANSHAAAEPAVAEAWTNPRVYDLAYHFYEGGDQRAFEYQLAAGEAAMRAFAVDQALEHLSKANAVIPQETDRGSRFRLYERLGTACVRNQQLPDALQSLQKAVPYASTVLERAQVNSGMGECYHRMGDFPKAVDAFDAVLRELRYSHAKSWLRVALEIPRHLVVAVLHRLVRPESVDVARESAALAALTYHSLSTIYLVKGDALRYSYVSSALLPAALRSGRYDLIAFGFGKLGYNFAVSSIRFAAKWMLKRARYAARQCHAVVPLASATAAESWVLYCFGELAEAERLSRDSLETLERAGDSWIRLAGHHNLRHIHSVQGNSAAAMAEATIEIQTGDILQDPETICWGEYGLADSLARMGQVQAANHHIEKGLSLIEGRDSALTASIAHNHYGFVLLQSSCYEKAIEVLEQSHQLNRQNFLYFDYMIRTYPLLIEALVGPDWLESRNDTRIRRARSISRWFGWLTRRFPNYYPHLLRVQGRLLCVTGQQRKAASYFRKSIDKARRLGAEYDTARALLDLAVIDTSHAALLRGEAVNILHRIKAVIPFAERWQLGDTPDESCIAAEFQPSI